MTDSQNAAAPAAPRKRRRFRKLVFLSLALLVVGRVVLGLAAAPVICAVAGMFGLGCEVRSLDLAILKGDFELHGLRVWPEDGSPDEPVLELEFALLDVATSKLFSGELLVRRLEADGLDLHAKRDANGDWNFAPIIDSFLASSEDDPADDEAEETDEDTEAFDGFEFDLPFTVEAVRGSHLRLHLADALAEPALDTTVTAALRLSNLGDADRRTTLMVAARGPVVLDALEITADASATRDDLELDLDMRVRGLAPRPLAGYLEFLGLEPVADRLDAESRLRLEGHRSDSGGTRFALTVESTDWKADSEECLALDDWSAAVDIQPGPAVVVEPLTMQGARAVLGRDSDGRFVAAGFAVVGAPDSRALETAPDERPVADEPPVADAGAPAKAQSLAEALPFPLRLEGVTVTECAVRFDDQVMGPDSPLALELREFRLGALDSAAADEATPWSAALAAPGTLGAIDLNGSLTPFAKTAQLRGEVATAGGDLQRVQPYLEHLGLESSWKDARFAARLDTKLTPQDGGAWSIDVAIEDVSLGEADAEEPWAAFRSATLDELLIDPAGRRIALTEARLAGLTGSALRTETGAWKALGLQPHVLEDGQVVVHVGGSDADADDTGEAQAETPDVPVAPDDASKPTAARATPWRVEVARFAIEDTDLALRDEALDPPLDLHLDDLGLELNDLAIGGDAKDTRRAELRVWLREPGLADDLQLTGDLHSQPGVLGVSWDLSIEGQGLAPTTLTPYLTPLGIEIVAHDAAAHADVAGSLAMAEGGVHLDIEISDFALGSQDAPFVELGALKLAGVQVNGNTIHADEISLNEPSVRFARDAEGALLAAGLRFAPAPPEEPEAAEAQADGAAEAELSTVAVVVDDREVHDPLTAIDALGLEVELQKLAVNAARIHWSDDALDDPIESTFLLDAGVDGLALRRGAAAAQWMIRGQFDGAPPTLQLEGELALDPQDIRLEGQVTGEHLDLQRVAVYLPPTIRSDAEDSHLHLAFKLRSSSNEAGGRGLLMECTDLELRDANAEAAALTVDSMRLDVPRLDLAERRFAIEEVTTSGVELRVHRDEDSRLHLLSMLIDPSAKPAVEAPVEPVQEPTTRRISNRAAAADSDLPEITIETLDVGIDRLVFTDAQQGEGAAPLVLTMRASIAEPLVLMNSAPGDLEPYRLDLTFGASPLVEQFGTEVVIAPFGDQPRLESTIALRGLNGAGIVDLMPRLATAIDAGRLQAGEFDAHIEVLLDARRRGLTGFELRRGFGLDVIVDGVAYRAEPDGEVLAGFASFEVNAPRIIPARKEVQIERIELVDPVGRVERDEDGVHLLGLVIDPVAMQAALAPPEGASEPTDDAEAAAPEEPATPSDAGADATARAIEAAAPKREEPMGEVRVDDLLISGLDFRFDDKTYDPPLEFPLTGLSFEVSRFTTRALTERRPIRVNAYVEAGEVPLGEDRPPALLFDEATLRGNVSVYPALDGTVNAGVSNLALRGLRGPAAASGVTIGDGTMDSNLRVRLKGEDGMRIDIDTLFRDLSVSEPSDGPISRYLGIAMPLETALFALRKSNGNIEISPPTISMSSSGISAAEVTRVATQAVAKEITLAVARSPFRLTKGVADTAGGLTDKIPIVGGVTGGIFGGVSNLMGGGEEEQLPPIGSLNFYVGDVNLLPEERPQLDEAIRRMRDDKKAKLVLVHEFTQEDIDRAMELANPSAEDCRQLARGLRRKRAELLRVRDEVTALVRAQLLTGREEEAARSTVRLRALDDEVGRTEDALDKTLALLQPGAERRAERRGREAALDVAQARLDAVVQALRDAGIKKLDERVDVRIPRPRPAEADESEETTSKGGRVKLLMD